MTFALPQFCAARSVSGAAALLVLASLGANYETANFSVTADNAETAKSVAELAEQHRGSIARQWFGEELPAWPGRCRITVHSKRLDANGRSVYTFAEEGGIRNIRMTIEGPAEEMLASVLPHEVSHIVFATYFNHPLPRWADEGMATLSEADAERYRQKRQAGELLRDRKKIPLRSLLRMKEYPAGQVEMVILYTQGFTLSEFLVQQEGGRGKFVELLDAARMRGWEPAVRDVYGFETLDVLEQRWQEWLKADLKKLDELEPGEYVAEYDDTGAAPAVEELVSR